MARTLATALRKATRGSARRVAVKKEVKKNTKKEAHKVQKPKRVLVPPLTRSAVTPKSVLRRQTASHVLAKNVYQQRFGIRLRGKQDGNTKEQWLVPPQLMSARMVTAQEGSQDVKEAPHAWERRTDPASASGQIRVAVQGKQSGVVGVWYHPPGRSWVAKWHEEGRFGHKIKQKYFFIGPYAAKYNSWEKGEAKALKEAVKFRQSMVKSGKIKVMNQYGRRAPRVSGVRGVTWHVTQKLWIVRIVVRGKTYRCGRFKPMNDSEDAIEEARKSAVTARQRCERKYFNVRRSGLSGRSRSS